MLEVTAVTKGKNDYLTGQIVEEHQGHVENPRGSFRDRVDWVFYRFLSGRRDFGRGRRKPRLGISFKAGGLEFSSQVG